MGLLHRLGADEDLNGGVLVLVSHIGAGEGHFPEQGFTLFAVFQRVYEIRNNRLVLLVEPIEPF